MTAMGEGKHTLLKHTEIKTQPADLMFRLQTM